MATKKLTSVDTIKGMWNGVVVFKFMGCQTEQRIHIGLSDSDRIAYGVSANQVVCEIIKKHVGYPNITVVGVKPDRAMKKASSPFSK